MALKNPRVEEVVDPDRAERSGPLDENLGLWKDLEKPRSEDW